MATHGSIGEFQGHPEGWTEYIERLECYFTANDVATDEKRRAILLAYCGDATYSTIRSLVAPRKLTEVPYDDLVKLAQAHYNPRPSQIVQRFKFNSRTQQAGESIASYDAELRRLSEHCGFGQSLDDMLRDRLVCGLAQARIQQRLLAEVDLTLDNQSINQSINQSYTALSPMLEVAGIIFYQFCARNSSHHAVLNSSIINCSIYFQIISPSFPWSSPRSLSGHIFHIHLLYHPVICHFFHLL